MGDQAEPVRVDVSRQEEYSRLLPLVKWLLVIPHAFALVFVLIGALFVLIFAWFAVVVTGRYPQGAFDYLTGMLRWMTRVNGYALLMTDRYPAFSMQHDPEYPVTFEVEYPADGVERWRPFFAWLLIIPYAFLSGLLNALGGIAALISFFAILFTKRYPEGLFEMVLVSMRWNARTMAYGHFLITKYPPFRWG